MPIMLQDAGIAAEFASAMLDQGVYVVAFSYPVVARGKARIRTQMSAWLSRVDFALRAFAAVKQKMGL